MFFREREKLFAKLNSCFEFWFRSASSSLFARMSCLHVCMSLFYLSLFKSFLLSRCLHHHTIFRKKFRLRNKFVCFKMGAQFRASWQFPFFLSKNESIVAPKAANGFGRFEPLLFLSSDIFGFQFLNFPF